MLQPRLIDADESHERPSAVEALRQPSSAQMRRAMRLAGELQRVLHQEAGLVMVAKSVRIFATRFLHLVHVPVRVLWLLFVL